MTTPEIRKYLSKTDFRITPLEFSALVNSNKGTIQKILLENPDAIYTILTKDGARINVEIIEEPSAKILELKKDSN